MSIEKYKKGVITTDEIEAHENVEEMFFRQIQMRGDKVMKKLSTQFHETKKKVFENSRIEYCMKKVSLDSIDENSVTMAGGISFESQTLASVLGKSEELILCVITIHGYDQVEKAANDGLDMLFVDGWGTALVECGYSYMQQKLEEELKKHDLFSTHGWSPGQHNVDITLQEPLFDVLKPQEIGVKLSKTYMMYPKKSISGIIGIGSNPSQKGLRACDVCPRRDTCPSAYSESC